MIIHPGEEHVGKNEDIYVLGSSKDVLRLDKTFFDDNFTIGINQSFKRAEDVGGKLTMWVCLDEFFKFYDWARHTSKSVDTKKFVPIKYLIDSRMGNAWKEKERRGVYLYTPRNQFVDHVYGCRFNGKGGIILDEMCYTIFTALSLAVLMKPKRIILRGVSLKGDYFDSAIYTSRDVYYDDIRRRMLKIAIPGIRSMGIDIENRTYDTELIIPEK